MSGYKDKYRISRTWIKLTVHILHKNTRNILGTILVGTTDKEGTKVFDFVILPRKR